MKYPNGRDEPCEICGDGGHTEIACTSNRNDPEDGQSSTQNDTNSPAPTADAFSDDATLTFWLPPKDKARHIATVWDSVKKEFILYVDGEFQDYKAIQYAFEDDEPSIEDSAESQEQSASMPSLAPQTTVRDQLSRVWTGQSFLVNEEAQDAVLAIFTQSLEMATQSDHSEVSKPSHNQVDTSSEVAE